MSKNQKQKQQVYKEKAGVVVYDCSHGDEPLVLIVTSRKFSGTWVFPVGSVDKGESLETAAKRECAEEAGYLVEVESKFQDIEVPKRSKTLRFTFFLATTVGTTELWEKDRKRDWVPLSKLIDKMPSVFQDVAREAVQRVALSCLD